MLATTADANELLALSDDRLVARLCPPATLEAWTFSANELRGALRGDRVLCPSIELSNLCNLNCPYCYVESAKAAARKAYDDQLSPAELQDIIRELADAGARTINIIGAGEPTVDPWFESAIRLIASLGVRPLVATNGIKIADSPRLVAILAETGSSVVLKCNSRRSAVQDALVGKSGYTSVRDRALDFLLRSGFTAAHPTRLALNTLLMTANEDEILSIYEFCRDNNIALIAGDYMPTGRTEGGEFRGQQILLAVHSQAAPDPGLFNPVSATKREWLTREIAARDRAIGISPPEEVAYVSGLPCIQGLGLCIDNRGRVFHCPARSQVSNGIVAAAEVATVRDSPSLLGLWRCHSYLRWFRRSFDGQCPYKPSPRNSVNRG